MSKRRQAIVAQTPGVEVCGTSCDPRGRTREQSLLSCPAIFRSKCRGPQKRRSALRIPAIVASFLLLWLAIPLAARDYPPDVPPPKPITIPSPSIQTLPNGMQVVVVERH